MPQASDRIDLTKDDAIGINVRGLTMLIRDWQVEYIPTLPEEFDTEEEFLAQNERDTIACLELALHLYKNGATIADVD